MKEAGKLISIWKRVLSLKYMIPLFHLTLGNWFVTLSESLGIFTFQNKVYEWKNIYYRNLRYICYFDNNMTLAQTQNDTKQVKSSDKKSYLCIRSIIVVKCHSHHIISSAHPINMTYPCCCQHWSTWLICACQFYPR